MLRVMTAASRAQAKVVLVGDHRQLGAVGPGGGFESLVAPYGAAVHVLNDNVRQRDVADHAALAELRDGDVAKAVASYARRSRIVAARDRSMAIDAVVSGWAADVAGGHQAAMYAWRRVDVAELNRRGREAWRALGRLGGEELIAPRGTPYAPGDRVVALAPGAGGSVVTSETTVVSPEAKAMALVVRMDDGGDLRRDWVAEHPEAARRLDHLASEIDTLDERLERARGVPERGIGRGRPGTWTPRPMARELDRGTELGL